MSKTIKGDQSREAAAVYVEIDKLTPWDRNPRHNDHAVDEVAASIRRFGFGAPIIARKADGMVIAGHTRIKAAKSLGLSDVPVRYLDISEQEAIALALADNKLGEISTWDEAAVSDILASLDDNLSELTGFDDPPEIEPPEVVEWAPANEAREALVVIIDADSTQRREVLDALEAAGFQARRTFITFGDDWAGP